MALPPLLARMLAPRDRNGDGYLDRDYVFVPVATGISCGATSASLTGTLANGTAFSGTDPSVRFSAESRPTDEVVTLSGYVR